MGKKGPLTMVTPDEFRSRTSEIGRRNGAITKVDAAYDAYYALRSEANSDALYAALKEYLKTKGGYWSKVSRDKTSGGLLSWLYEFTTPRTVPTVLTRDDTLDQRAIHRLKTHDIPHSRYGVLYLFGNIDIDMNKLSIALEGVAAVGGV